MESMREKSLQEISVGERILLWTDTAPYTSYSPTRFQPVLTAYPVAEARGAVIVCPGGGYAEKAEYEGAPVARMLNSAGIAAFVLDYRVAPCHCEAPVTDALRSIRLLRMMGYQKVGILGFSAGGHVACSAATLYDTGDPGAADPVERQSARPDAFVPCYPVVSMGRHSHAGSRKNLLGVCAEDAEAIRRFSAEENVTPDTPPAFIWHTAADKAVPVQNSLQLASALAERKVPFEMHVYPEGCHGLALCSEQVEVSAWGNACCLWLLKLGFGV